MYAKAVRPLIGLLFVLMRIIDRKTGYGEHHSESDRYRVSGFG